MADTIRLTNLKFLLAALSGLDLTGPNDRDSISAGTATHFSVLVLGPIGDLENRHRYSAGIVPGDEVKHTLFPIMDCTLPVTVEFRMTWNTGDQLPEEEAERVLGLIQKALQQDRTLGGNALDFYETGNAIALDIYADKSIVGAVHFEMRYRHQIGDPTQII